MSEAENQNTAQGGQQFAIQRLYIKDVSFETPNSPAIFTQQVKSDINLELNTVINKLEESVYEVALQVTVTSKAGDKTAFLVEVQQAGIFTIAGFNDAELGHMLNSYCANLLFPYAREVVSDLVTKGSFPQLLLAPVNFDALYAQHLQQQPAQQTSGSDDSAVH
jgi:preprotein translocase subunit SecB